MARTGCCVPDIPRGRLRKSCQFLGAASLIAGQADEDAEIERVYVTLCAAGRIAAPDAFWTAGETAALPDTWKHGLTPMRDRMPTAPIRVG
jgi:hypothetical protein